MKSFQWNGDALGSEGHPQWLAEKVIEGYVWESLEGEGLKVDTAEGIVLALPGDSIICDPAGELQVQKPAYERV